MLVWILFQIASRRLAFLGEEFALALEPEWTLSAHLSVLV